MNYTPGPWRYATDGSQVTTSALGILEGSKRICFLSTPYKDQDEINANGILIEAAPDMIDVIEKVDKYFIDLQNRCALTPSEEKLWSKITAVKHKALWYEPTKKR